MTDALLFTLIFSGLFVLRIVLATVFFALILPAGDRCLQCDAPTVRLSAPFLDRWMPWFRKRWCLRCGWQGVLRRGTVTADTAAREPVAPLNGSD